MTVRKHQGIIGITFAVVMILALVITSWPKETKTVDSFVSKNLPAPEVTEIPLQTSGTVQVNTADLEDLQELPGIGETMAQAILDEREAHGSFYYPEDLLAVRGVGEKKLSGLMDWLDFSPAQEEAAE